MFLQNSSSIMRKLNEINLAGFDGREVSEKNFWQYSNKTKQNIERHKLNHPSFFDDRNIDNYYKNI